MKWALRRILPLLLATASLALPSSAPDYNDNRPSQAAFRTDGTPDDFFLQWERPPNPNSTHHLIFNSVSGFMQLWPNTFRRNGHGIVPATIPTGTTLYHGRVDDRVPDAPDWLAFDFDHAYVFCISTCHVLSVQTKRDLRLLYFDGSSAAKMKDGPMDSQDIVAWRKLQPDKYLLERERIRALCDWGKPFGLDGFVRMEFHFEVMICDFLDGLEIVTFLDLLPHNMSGNFKNPYWPPLPVPRPHPPSGWRGSVRSAIHVFFEAHVSGTWHDRAPGETRVHIDYAGLVTFYDPTLSSLVESRQGKDGVHYRLKGISPTDTERVHAELRSVLTRRQGTRSGVDWGSIARVVTERYADRLEYLRFLLSPNATSIFADAAEQAAAVRGQLLIMLVAYISTEDMPPQLPASANASWVAPVVHRCATTQTSRIPLGMLTPQEVRIHAAVEGTLREICRRLTLAWLEFFDVEGESSAKAAEAIEVGRMHIDELMSWLDWSLWVRCSPACGFEEICHLPSWPFSAGDDPYDLTPRCVSAIDLVRSWHMKSSTVPSRPRRD